MDRYTIHKTKGTSSNTLQIISLEITNLDFRQVAGVVSNPLNLNQTKKRQLIKASAASKLMTHE